MTADESKNAPRFGTAVEGRNRFPRPALEEEFDDMIERSNGARLFGLRRTGKSTEARALCARLRLKEPGTPVIEIDAQGMASEATLLVEMLKKIPANAKSLSDRLMTAMTSDSGISQVARDAISKHTGGSADVQAYFGPLMQALERTLTHQDKVVLVIDELPWLCRSILEHDATQGRQRIDLLLASLRRLRDRGVRMLLLGSVGMAALLRQYGLHTEHLNDLGLLEVPPLADDEPADYLQWLVTGSEATGWTDKHSQQCLEECGAHYPAVIHLAFMKLSVGGRAAPLARIEAIFADKVRPDFDAAIYAQFDRRLQLYRQLPDGLSSLLPKLLDAAMRHPQQCAALADLRPLLAEGADDSDLRDALAILREDGFLSVRVPRNAAEQWRPASTLVVAWWAQSH
ncbi:hypothetical protein [Roseateles sp.]|uniref:hypothetical protein n=1 Tax=Roseateles sp. TaxID=1971397 RepID=UPI0032638107